MASRDFGLTRGVCVAALMVVLGLGAATAQEQKVAVIDVQRLLAESIDGKAVLERLKTIQQEKVAEADRMQKEMASIQEQLVQGRLSLSEERLTALAKQAEDLRIGFQRFQTDADRELQDTRDKEFAAVEERIMPIIDQHSREQGYTMVFNKFQSGLLFAADQIDVTGKILEILDATSSANDG